MSDLPTRTVTFLFTDIEGSTKRWEQYPQQMRVALSRHDAILRTAIEENGGYVFKTMGDAFCAAFSAPINALQAAITAQRSLHAEQWIEESGSVKARMALHIGVVDVQDGDYFGQPVNRVARLLSAGHGAQTLLSGATQELVRDTLAEGVHILDMGEHRLKDLTRPEHIFQLVVPDLPSEFPPLKTLDNRPNNLPRQSTSLIGRETEIEAACALFRRSDVTLATLTGPGGTGKTRLALQAGAELLEEFKDGVWFVGLAALVDPALVITTIAQTLGVKEAAGQPLIETLKGYLHDKQMILLLDNFEQVKEAAPQVDALLKAAPSLKAMVTSRLPLKIYGEKEYPVPPLALPDHQHLPPIERLTQYEAVRLFIERARDVKPDFEVTNDNAPAVAEICVRLDGLPLAIELAAARTRLFAPGALLTRLSSRLKMLTGGAGNLPARQQTLRNTIEWSYDLLTEGEKQLFRRMAVFQGGRTLEGLEAVCDSEALQVEGRLEMDVLEGVESLVSKSLLQQREGSEGSNGEPRFWILETIHEYAREKLQEGGEAEPLEREHALYFMRLAEEAEPHLRGEKQVEWLSRLEDEYDNIRAALWWSREQRDQGDADAAEIGLRIAGAILRFWYVRGYFSEGREQFERALSSRGTSGAEGAISQVDVGVGGAARAKALNGAGVLACAQGDYAAARSLYEESLAIRRELEDKRGIAYSLNNLGIVALEQGDYAAARSLQEESLAIRRELGDKRGIAESLNNLGIVVAEQGDYPAARSLQEESLAIKRELGDKQGITSSLASLGRVVARAAGTVGMGQPQLKQAVLERAATLFGAVEGILEAMSGVLYSVDRHPYERNVAAVRSALGEEAFGKAWAEGRAMSMEQAIEYALEES